MNIQHYIRPHGKIAFLRRFRGKAVRVLDIGCGNNSVSLIKRVLPNCHYVGLDIGDYNQESHYLMDQYVIVDPDDFANEISKHNVDLVISAHNLEHVNDRKLTLENMCRCLASGGWMYLSFPSEASVHFPSRIGTLNYFDDATHDALGPPSFDGVLEQLEKFDLCPVKIVRRSRPPVLWLLGLLNEARSRASGKLERGTWGYYGFESVIWAVKK